MHGCWLVLESDMQYVRVAAWGEGVKYVDQLVCCTVRTDSFIFDDVNSQLNLILVVA